MKKSIIALGICLLLCTISHKTVFSQCAYSTDFGLGYTDPVFISANHKPIKPDRSIILEIAVINSNTSTSDFILDQEIETEQGTEPITLINSELGYNQSKIAAFPILFYFLLTLFLCYKVVVHFLLF